MFSFPSVAMAARITKYLNKYVRRCIFLIYMSSFYFWSPPLARNTLFTPIKGRIDSLTVYINKAETCTNILRYNTCMSSYPGDRRGICLIYMSSFYFWSPPLARKMQKTNMPYYPEYPSGSWHPILAP
jgi:putative SOS response-associated peptidase YedK